ncbi:hypothetical protein, partial [Bradyrhizobium japonicum]|uniref:hypothetical protein n=1 Tax=Bradyrhizobium japonicum TaxID=375 RepID=UPI001AEC7189
MREAGNCESSPNHILWLWVADLRSASLRLSGTTTEIDARSRINLAIRYSAACSLNSATSFAVSFEPFVS